MRNFQAGWSVKATKMLVNCTVVSRLTEKIQRFKGSWDGKMYVFDERIAVDINHVDPVVVGKDWFDGTPCERYASTAVTHSVNRRMLASEENEDKYLRGCSH